MIPLEAVSYLINAIVILLNLKNRKYMLKLLEDLSSIAIS